MPSRPSASSRPPSTLLSCPPSSALSCPSIPHLGVNIPITSFFSCLSPSKATRMVTVTPDSDFPLGDEPIEAGNLRGVRGGSRSKDSSRRVNSLSGGGQSEEEKDELARVKRKEEAYKTALCDAHRRNGQCSYGRQCRFAHGEQELRLPPQPRGKAHPKYKTQLCDKFSVNGHCPYGPRCQFIHMMKKGLPLVEYERCVKMGAISPTHKCDEVDAEKESSLPNRRRSDPPAPSTVYRQSPNGQEKGRSASAKTPMQSPGKLATPRRPPPARTYELSLIHEETEHQSPPSSAVTGKPPHTHWSQVIFGRKADLLRESNSGGRLGDVQLLNESCDEELLAGGAYASRYPSPPLLTIGKRPKNGRGAA